MGCTMRLLKLLLSIAAFLSIGLQTSFGVIVPGGRDASGTLDGSGTNKNPAPFTLGTYTGQVGGFLATAISPQYIITATHIGPQSTFIYADGGASPQTYNITSVPGGSLDDLTIYKITGPQSLTHFIPIYTGNNEVGQQMVVIGNGTTRGAPVFTPPANTNLAGWQWGPGSTLRSWGTNIVDSIVNLDSNPPNPGPPFLGNFLHFSFSNPSNPDNAVLSPGDSGGPLFVLDPSDNQWKLAGINSLVDEVHQNPGDGGFGAALFDARGFFDDNGQVITGSDPVPLGSYDTRISSRQDFINSIIGVPEPSSLVLMGCVLPGVYLVIRKYRMRAA
jgi:hypothetical protein